MYHAAFLCLFTPVLFLYIYNIKWDKSIDKLVEQGSMILFVSYAIPLGIVYMVNTLKANNAAKFIQKWHLFWSDNTIYDEDVKINPMKRARVGFVFNTISQIILSMVLSARYYPIMDWSKECESHFASLYGSPWLLNVVCALFAIMGDFSSISVSLTTCFYALVSINLAEEFDKLHRVIYKLASSPRTDMDVWEQVRFRHEALVSLVYLHDQLSTMLLGPILVGYVGYLGFNVYQIFVVEASLVCIINVIITISALGAMITTSNILDNKVSERTLLFRSETHVTFNCLTELFTVP